MERAATIKDIARELGVSTSTVSRILNGKNQRNQELVKKVQEAAKRLNYQVNTTARGLRTNKSGLLGIIVPYISDEFFSSALAGIEAVTELQGYNLLICQSNENPEKEAEFVKSLLACNVEGILISVTRNTPDVGFLEVAKAAGKKIVMFDRVIAQEDYPCIKSNDRIGAYKAGQHLLKTGKSKFLYIGFSARLAIDIERLAGYNEALAEAGEQPCETLYVDGMEAVQEGLADIWQNQYDAVLGFYDEVAAEAMTFLKSRNVTIPGQVAVIGFDNRNFCKYTTPPLTSIEHPGRKMGSLAAEALLGALNEEEVEQVVLDTHVVVRESSAR
ncbi:LacI family DNA-binding transcriptional regulator [Marinoscillum furvescens]|uniref:LacI family transcriptional regulator n=1 Tax=Marinoscillum furvescens DSM 4134 TaxID=1122208 RepID=A0A3D9L0B4_MARFU|nr:LacI family DNA-binding transcriptional regulator [Marinoscillum furvescens]RED93212.1 LacI family transcriptional regulator [Marinoscillum furvescens DSM 4134]